MNENITGILATIGVLVIIAMVGTIVCLAFQAIRDCIDRLKYEHRYKHRFDKPPTAECFCRDCKHHGDETNRCYKFDGWHTADNWFCWNAEPRDHKFENISKGEVVMDNIEIKGKIVPDVEGENGRYYVELPDGYRLIYDNDGYVGRYDPNLSEVIQDAEN